MIMQEYLNEKNLADLLEYLYPDSTWVYDKAIPNHITEERLSKNATKDFKKRRFRPDYRNEEKSIIVEFDGISHYQNSSVFWNDIEKEEYYNSLGYKFIQIPYFVQPTKEIIELYFGINVSFNLTEKLNGFNVESGRVNKNCPASFSENGIRRFMIEFNKFDDIVQNQIINTLYQNYEIEKVSLKILPLSLIEFINFEVTDEDKKYNKSFELSNYMKY